MGTNKKGPTPARKKPQPPQPARSPLWRELVLKLVPYLGTSTVVLCVGVAVRLNLAAIQALAGKVTKVDVFLEVAGIGGTAVWATRERKAKNGALSDLAKCREELQKQRELNRGQR